ncbi:MAG TPA: trypsin-like peptidase domain-containing protein, partial [Vicinamibacterales bacterium]|nr:trypsin-like peptidase domain-containing protein [Vicinamibacterales bacterium]
MTRFTGPLLGLAIAVGFLMGLVAAGTWPAAPTTALPVRPVVTAPLALTPGPGPAVGREPAGLTGVDFAAVAARLNAAVVNVDAAARSRDDRTRSLPQRWSREFGDDSTAPREGSGSGFIIDPAGYVLTNYHVVEHADRITLTLSDQRVFRAEIVGVDPAIDVALLKVNTTERLPVAPLGRSEALRVGEWVCAIGNPYRFEHSVTVGVVSSKGRKIYNASFDAY